jgi:hypothetical protein
MDDSYCLLGSWDAQTASVIDSGEDGEAAWTVKDRMHTIKLVEARVVPYEK